jgi:DNA ligase D-like protein (predicted ligase)
MAPSTDTRPRHRQGLEQRPGPQGFVPLMHPRLVERPPQGLPWLHEVKFDGYRMQVQVKAGRARFLTRNGLDWTERFPGLSAMAGELRDCVLDAELCALDANGYSSFSKLRSAIFKAPDTLVLFVFDLLFEGEDDQRPYATTARKHRLRAVLDEAPHIGDHFRYVEEVTGAGAALLTAACQLSWEGIVSKRRDAPYKAGRTDLWQKAKCRPSASIVVGGYVTKNDRFAYLLGGLREADGRLRYVGSIKGGYASPEGQEVQRRIKALAATVSPFDIDSPRKSRDIHWLRPDLIAEVEMAEFTGSGKLRQSSFKGLRDDLAG